MKFINSHRIPGFMTNILRDKAELIDRAAEETGFPVFWLDDATAEDGTPLIDCIAVYTASNADHEPFWKRFDELKRGQI